MDENIDICYLCGQRLNGEVDRDHVPPKQFYARELRQNHNLDLFTLPVHRLCNKAYQKDEDYFVASIGSLTMESYSGKALFRDILQRSKRPKGQRIAKMVLREFDLRPSGLLLPFGKVAKRFDGERVCRVVWKIVRGLFFKETGQFLPDDVPRNYRIYLPDENPPAAFNVALTQPSRGQYAAVFDYKYIYIGNAGKMYLWAMLFWDRIITLVGFHVPGCLCRVCIEGLSLQTR